MVPPEISHHSKCPILCRASWAGQAGITACPLAQEIISHFTVVFQCFVVGPVWLLGPNGDARESIYYNNRIIWLERTYKIIKTNPSPSYVKATTMSLSVTSTHLSSTSWDDESHTSHHSDSFFFKHIKKHLNFPDRGVSFSKCSYKQPMLAGYQDLSLCNCPS